MFLDLSKQGDYDIAAAIRGPDSVERSGNLSGTNGSFSYYSASVDLKEFTTAVVRYLAGVQETAIVPRPTVNAPEVASHLWGLYADERKLKVRTLWAHTDTYHFRKHIISALMSLGESGAQWYKWLGDNLSS